MRLVSGARMAWSGVLARTLWALAMLGLAGTIWVNQLLRRAGQPDLMSFDPLLFLADMSAATVGAVLAIRRPRNPVGWLLLALGVFLGADGVAAGYGPYALLVRPGALPAAAAVASYYPTFAIAALACIGFVLLLTPTGSLPSPRWRWWSWVAAAAPIVDLLVVTLTPKPAATQFEALESPFDLDAVGGVVRITHQTALAVTILAVAIAAASLVVRFRRARGTERQQLRWVALAAVLVGMLAVVGVAALAAGSTGVIGSGGAQLGVALIPVAIGAAILRFRLYDLDRIISRTLAYGLLTVLLGGGYFAVALALGQLLGRDSSLVVAAATLAVAGVFRPARRRVQGLVDQRFNRSHYDAAGTIQAFSLRLREEIDLDALTAELLAVVDEAMQPTQGSLWIRPPLPPNGS